MNTSTTCAWYLCKDAEERIALIDKLRKFSYFWHGQSRNNGTSAEERFPFSNYPVLYVQKEYSELSGYTDYKSLSISERKETPAALLAWIHPYTPMGNSLQFLSTSEVSNDAPF